MVYNVQVIVCEIAVQVPYLFVPEGTVITDCGSIVGRRVLLHWIMPKHTLRFICEAEGKFLVQPPECLGSGCLLDTGNLFYLDIIHISYLKRQTRRDKADLSVFHSESELGAQRTRVSVILASIGTILGYSAPACRVCLCVRVCIVLSGGVMGGFVPIPVVRILVLTVLYVLGGFEGLLILPFPPGEKRSEKIRGRAGKCSV